MAMFSRFAVALVAAACLAGLVPHAASGATAIGTPGGATMATGVLTLSSSGLNRICQLGLQIGLSPSIPKMADAVLGRVNPSPASWMRSCNPATISATVAAADVSYRAFSGALPNISAINASVRRFQFTMSGFPYPPAGCLYTGWLTTNAYGAARTLSWIATNGTFSASSPGCPTWMSVTGTLTFSPAVLLHLL